MTEHHGAPRHMHPGPAIILVEKALAPTGYFRTDDMKPTMVQNLRAILQRAGFTKDEIDALHGVIGAFERRANVREDDDA